MLIQNGDGTYTGGPLDVILVLKNTETQRYHVAFYEERMMPGGLDAQPTEIVRLKSKLSHTKGATTLEELEGHITDFAAKIQIPEANVWRRLDQHVEFEGEVPPVMVVRKWTMT